jgi:uncharacterized protein (DUF1501 family)
MATIAGGSPTVERGLDRRMFVLGGLAGVGALQPLAGALGRRRPGPERTLVLVQLTGGQDGLSMLVPAVDDAYARARKSTRIAAADVLALDERVGLHPELRRLRRLYGEGKLALIEGVGYPEPNRSHFRSLDIWHAADPRGRGVEAGWIGRCVQRLPEPGPLAVVHLGARPPFALHAPRHAPLALTAGLLRATDPARARARDVPGGAPGSPG